MKVYLNRFTALILVCTLVVTSLSVSSFATDYQSKYNFWNWAYDNSWFLGKLIIGSADNVCSVSEDTLHHSTNHQKGEVVDGEQQYTCICDDCGQTFSAVATDLANSYDDGSDGYQTIDSSGRLSGFGKWTYWVTDLESIGIEMDSPTSLRVEASSGYYSVYFTLCYEFMVPDDCVVVFDGPFTYTGTDGEVEAFHVVTTEDAPWKKGVETTFIDNVRRVPVEGGVVYRYSTNRFELARNTTTSFLFTVPLVYVELDDPLSKYQHIPVNIGGSVQYTDDNSNNKIYDAEFMDFSTNEYHNPVTDYSTKVDNWEYDYSTRTYTGYTENGEVKIVYGDENITVVEGGNTYNYYYASPSSGGGGSGSDDGSSGDDEGLFGKLGELLGTLLGGLIDLITGVLSNVMDNLIALVTMTIEKLGSIVNLFGSFGDALRSLWSWLPDDIITILSAGVSVVIFACVIKLFI